MSEHICRQGKRCKSRVRDEGKADMRKCRADLVKSGVAAGATNTLRPLTHSSDSSREGLAVKATRTCTIDSCDSKLLARGWCAKHYWRWQTHGSALAPVRTSTDVCSVGGCDKPHQARGWCQTHYLRWKRHGTPEAGINTEGAESERFARFLANDLEPSDCWEWQGHRNNRGYGKFGRKYAHRFSYELYVGMIPPGMELLHSCDNPPCVNPRHLTPGTHEENMADMARKGRGRRA